MFNFFVLNLKILNFPLIEKTIHIKFSTNNLKSNKKSFWVAPSWLAGRKSPAVQMQPTLSFTRHLVGLCNISLHFDT